MTAVATDLTPTVTAGQSDDHHVGLSDNERLLHNGCQKGCTADVVRALNDIENVDCPEEHGMTPLQQAAYRGHLDLCRLLLDRGADVNWHRHEHGYTTLMFAALCGNTNVVSFLLDAGASTIAVNAVGRNAAQMAAFVGNHDCVSVISNYVPLADVEYYAESHGITESEPRLSRCLARPLHRLVSTTNVHPVAVVLFLQDPRVQNGALFDAADRVVDVLELMCRREAKKGDRACNEVLCLKLHLLARIVEACATLAQTIHVDKQKQRQSEVSGAAAADTDHSHSTVKAATLDEIIRRWLRGRKEDGFPEILERLLCNALRNFPFPHLPLVQQLVRALTSTSSKDDNGDCPSALGLVTATVRGQRFGSEDEDLQCAACGSLAKSNKKCSACKLSCYCGPHCQRLHWFVHKRYCQPRESLSSS